MLSFSECTSRLDASKRSPLVFISASTACRREPARRARQKRIAVRERWREEAKKNTTPTKVDGGARKKKQTAQKEEGYKLQSAFGKFLRKLAF